ncbi:MAG: glutathione S-transferase N-terminal domain-containing protein [Coriobacteriales bacterium]|jgi:glutaredoxin|nr:glutathione S-transferase N-terminal domain-containing protein [Coriobacteriales bacterium]
MEELALYYLPTCPYCMKVLQFMEANGIIIDLKSTTEPEAKKRLLEVGKMNQVPCLFINGEALYESDDIIAYLAKRFAVKA